MNNTETQAT